MNERAEARFKAYVKRQRELGYRVSFHGDSSEPPPNIVIVEHPCLHPKLPPKEPTWRTDFDRQLEHIRRPVDCLAFVPWEKTDGCSLVRRPGIEDEDTSPRLQEEWWRESA